MAKQSLTKMQLYRNLTISFVISDQHWLVKYSPLTQTIRSTCADSFALFLSRVSTLTCDIDIAILSVCLSVRPWRSGIRWKWLNTSS